MTVNFNPPIGIKNAIFINPHDPIMWELDEIKFSKKHPDLFANFLNVLSEQPDSDPREILDELFDSDEGLMFTISKTIPSVEIMLTNGSSQFISNKSLMGIHKGSYVDRGELRWEHQFVYCILDRCLGQSGTLGIWDIAKEDWCFFHSDESFCVTEVQYNFSDDSFSGIYEYHYAMTPVSGRMAFKVTSNRQFRDVE